MSSGCERLYGWNAVDDRTQPACLSAHAPRVEAGARERGNGEHDCATRRQLNVSDSCFNVLLTGRIQPGVKVPECFEQLREAL